MSEGGEPHSPFQNAGGEPKLVKRAPGARKACIVAKPESIACEVQSTLASSELTKAKVIKTRFLQREEISARAF
eukprot:4729044-Pleurochrysis_carterae.AAC.7